MNITKKDIQDKLIEIGCKPALVKMPAVVERLFGFGISLNKIKTDIDGNVFYGTHKFIFQKDETVIYEHGSNEFEKVIIDKYGMDKSALNGCVYRKNGKIIEKGDGKHIDYNDELIDDGGWSLDSFKISNFRTFNFKFSKEKLAYTISNYPNTENWYIENNFLPQDKTERQKIIRESILALIESLKESSTPIEIEEENSNDELSWLENPANSPAEEKERRKALSKEIERLNNFLNGVEPLLDYNELQAEINRIAFFKKKANEIETENLTKITKIRILKDFATQKCGKIPVVGKQVLKECSAIETLIPDKEIDKSKIPDTELGDAYKNYLEQINKSKQYTSALYEIRDCIVRLCGNTPFYGKRVMAELKVLARTNQTPSPDDINEDD